MRVMNGFIKKRFFKAIRLTLASSISLFGKDRDGLMRLRVIYQKL